MITYALEFQNLLTSRALFVQEESVAEGECWWAWWWAGAQTWMLLPKPMLLQPHRLRSAQQALMMILSMTRAYLCSRCRCRGHVREQRHILWHWTQSVTDARTDENDLDLTQGV